MDGRYLLCDFLAGDVENGDVTENVSAIWALQREITRFIPAERIFRRFCGHSEWSHDPIASR